MNGLFVKFRGDNIDIYEQALKDEVKLCKKLAETTYLYAKNKATYGQLDQARSDLINHMIFINQLENADGEEV